MNRRKFAKTAILSTAGIAVASRAMAQTQTSAAVGTKGGAFKLNFAPNFGQFKASFKAAGIADNDFESKLQYFYDQGFRAIEDNGMPNRSVEDQNKIAKKMEQLGMEMGVFVGLGMETVGQTPMWAGNCIDLKGRKRDKAAVREIFKKKLEDSLEVGKRVNAKWCTVVPGVEDPSVDPEYQFANVVEHLKFCSDICAKTGIIMVLEPLNYINHPAYFLKRIAQAYAICEAVNHPCCKILDDLYHQQVTEGNLIHNLNEAWKHIAYIQQGDVPGRKEPLTGEINYKNVFKHIHDKGFKGVYGMEHGQSDTTEAGDLKLINSYRAVDLD